MTTEEEEHDDTIVARHDTNVQVEIGPLSRLYAKVAHTHIMTFQVILMECDMDKNYMDFKCS